MKENYTHLTAVLDRSGSMEDIRDATIEGFNAFLKQQQAEPGTATLTLVQFDTQDPYEAIHRFKPIGEVPELSREIYVPRDGTPLLDAIGRAINDLEQSLGFLKVQDRPSKIVVVVVTDGQENSSREFGKRRIEEMIAEKTKKEDWQFVFLSSDMAAIGEARSAGMQADQVLMFSKSGQGSKRAWDSVSSQMSAYRSGRKGKFDFDPMDRQCAEDPCGPAAGAEAESLPLHSIGGHLFLEIGGRQWLFGTGSPSSFGAVPVELAGGESQHIAVGFMGLTADTLSRHVGVECAGLLGADILNRYDFVLDTRGSRAVVSRGELDLPGAAIHLREAKGVPVVPVRIGGIDRLMFFDTGARICYYQHDSLAAFPPAGRFSDFLPGAGEFETETYLLEASLAGEPITLRCGELPGILGAALSLASVEGIVGNEAMKNRSVGYFPRRSLLMLGAGS